MFTSQHYRAIADIIKRHTLRMRTEDVAHCSNGLPCLHPDTIGDLADYFAKDNPRFNRDKFLAACEGLYQLNKCGGLNCESTKNQKKNG